MPAPSRNQSGLALLLMFLIGITLLIGMCTQRAFSDVARNADERNRLVVYTDGFRVYEGTGNAPEETKTP